MKQRNLLVPLLFVLFLVSARVMGTDAQGINPNIRIFIPPTASPSPTVSPSPAPTQTVGPLPSPTAMATSGATPIASNVRVADLVPGTGLDMFQPGLNNSYFSVYGNVRVNTSGSAVNNGPIIVGDLINVFGTAPNIGTGDPTVIATIVTVLATPSPSPAPSTSPSPSSTSGAVFPNGQYPPTGTILYASTSVWNQVISYASPKPLANSAAIVAAQFPGAANAAGSEIRGQEAGQYDYGHVAYYAASTDILIHTNCNQYCPTTPVGDVLVPAVARPAGGSDAHLISIQPNHTEIDMWACYQQTDGSGTHTITNNWTTGATITCGNISNAGDLFTGPGQDAVGPGADAMNSALLAGQVTPAELISGHINHALFITGACAIGMQYPAPPGSGTGQCTSGVGPPLGGRMWYKVPCATTQASSSLDSWEKAILCALNVYGGYMGDDGGGGVNFVGLNVGTSEDAEAGYQYGQILSNGSGDPMAGLAPQGWYSNPISGTLTSARWYSDHTDNNGSWTPVGIDFKDNIVWLDPCVTYQNC